MSVEQLNEHRMRKKGEQMFLGCLCRGESGWQVVCVADATSPVISGLVCMDCGEERGVAYGKVGV